MDVPLSNDQNDVLRRIAEKEGFTDFELRTTSGSSKGDNYLGIITKVSIENHKRTLELIVKSAAKSEEFRKKFPIRKAYLREIYLYETLFPEFEAFQKEENIHDGAIGHAKIYGSCNNDFNEFLVLENLKEIGYELWDRQTPMTAEHVALVFKEYGKFHATSLAMKEKRPELYKKLTESLDNVIESGENKEEEIKVMKSVVQQGLKTVEGNQIATDALERYSLVVEKFFREDVLTPEDQLVVLHGDCWCNNLLFKNEDPRGKKPTKVCFIDWQLSCVGSPARDLSYFLFTCAPKEILSDYRTYLKIYHDSVCESLRRQYCDAETLFSFSLVEYHWQKYAKFGIHIALRFLKFMLSEGSEVPDLAEVANSGKDIMGEINSYTSVHDGKYKQRLLDMLFVAAENNWL